MAVTVADVRKVYDPSGLDDTALGVHLATAQMVVDEQLAVAGCSMTQERLDKITTYLAAHFAETSAIAGAGAPGLIKSEKMGEASTTYAVPTPNTTGGQGYMSTRWGQLAVALDLCKILLGVSTSKNFAQFEVVKEEAYIPGIVDVTP